VVGFVVNTTLLQVALFTHFGEGIGGERERLSETFMMATGGLERSKGGYAGPFGTWQQSKLDTPSENYADMFLGWTYGEWSSTGAGPLREKFMNRWMPGFLSKILN
jgi:hypothetical protein